MEQKSECNCYTSIKTYIIGAVAGLAIGLGVGAYYHTQVEHTSTKALYHMLKLDEAFRNRSPQFVKDTVGFMERLRSPEATGEKGKKKREQIIKDLEKKLQ